MYTYLYGIYMHLYKSIYKSVRVYISNVYYMYIIRLYRYMYNAIFRYLYSMYKVYAHTETHSYVYRQKYQVYIQVNTYIGTLSVNAALVGYIPQYIQYIYIYYFQYRTAQIGSKCKMFSIQSYVCACDVHIYIN